MNLHLQSHYQLFLRCAVAFGVLFFNNGSVKSQSTDSVIFRDDFKRATLGSFWNTPTSWNISNGAAYYFDGPDRALKTDKKYTQQSYIIETAAKGFTNSYFRQFRLTFGQSDLSNNNKTYVLIYKPDDGGRFILGKSIDNVFYPEVLDEIVLYPNLKADLWYKFKVARYKSGLIQVYVDRGSGYGSVPLLEAIDKTYMGMGYTGWETYTETAPENFFVDWIAAAQPLVDKPATREKPAEDALITQVSAKSKRAYNIAKLKAGVKVYTDRSYTVTSVPAYLNEASFIQTANDDKANKENNFLSAFIKRAAIVYIAYDPRGTIIPDWLTQWTKTGDRIQTTDPGSSYLEIYSRIVDYGETYPRPLLLGGNLAAPAAGSQMNYLVAAVPRPVLSPLEAENALLSGAVVASNHPGYNGTGFADYKNPSNDFIEWTVKIDVPGTYGLGFVFANGGATDRSLQVKHNGTVVDTLQFISLSSWSSWAFLSGTNIYLGRGVHKIRTTAIGSGGPNIDRLSLYYSGTDMPSYNLKKDFRHTEFVHHQLAPSVYPNPFKQRTKITYSVGEKSRVSFSLLSASGQPIQQLINATREEGHYQETIDGSRLAAGVYFYRLQIGNKVQVGKIVKL